MDELKLMRRRLKRRVAIEDRKRAARACYRCKNRKSKCIELPGGKCQRCDQEQLSCDFEPHTSPGHGIESVRAEEILPTTYAYDNSLSLDGHQHERVTWSNFLSNLRAAFSLGDQPGPDAHDLAVMQARINASRSTQSKQSQRLAAAMEAFPPQQIADFLVTVCIRHGTDVFFLFDQAKLMADLHEFYNDRTSPLRADSHFIALSLAIFALGNQWTTLARRAHDVPWEETQKPTTMWHEHLKVLIPDIIERPSVTAVQILNVMAIYLLPSSAIGSSYMYLGLAMRKAIAIELHLSSDDAITDAEERQLRRRLWWSVWALDRTTTVKLGRPRTIDMEIVTTPLPSYLESMDSVQMFNNLHLQLANIKLVQILDRVADPRLPRQPSLIASLESELKSWKQSLPASFQIAHMSANEPSYRAAIHLNLNYHLARLVMGRSALVTVVRSHLRDHIGGQQHIPPNNDVRTLDMSMTCRRAAAKILHLLSCLERTGNLTRFSFTDFQGCSIATIITLLSGILERDSEYNSRVAFGMSCLRKMAHGNMTATLGVRFVDAIQAIADEAVSKLAAAHQENDDNSEAANSVAGPSRTGSAVALYDQWVQSLQSTTDRQNTSEDHFNHTVPDARLAVSGSHDRETEAAAPMAEQRSIGEWIVSPDGGPQNRSWSADHDGHAAPVMGSIKPADHFDLPSAAVDGIDDAWLLLRDEEPNFLMGLTGLDLADFSSHLPMD